MEKGFHEDGILLRIAGDTLVVTPPLIISEDQIGEVFEKVGKLIAAVQ
jgi:beta-alanine--pyruvate transaminase